MLNITARITSIPGTFDEILTKSLIGQKLLARFRGLAWGDQNKFDFVFFDHNFFQEIIRL